MAVCPYGRLEPERGVAALVDGAHAPVHRRVYDLRSGECLDVAGLRVPVYPVRCHGAVVEVGLYTVESVPADPSTRAVDRAS